MITYYKNPLKMKEMESAVTKINRVEIEPNDADNDIVQVACECGNTFDIPWDVCAFGLLNTPNFNCGQCGKSECFKLIADPSPNKKDE